MGTPAHVSTNVHATISRSSKQLELKQLKKPKAEDLQLVSCAHQVLLQTEMQMQFLL
ncbi:unnamed protein product, partial [Lepidochelys kempii]